MSNSSENVNRDKDRSNQPSLDTERPTAPERISPIARSSTSDSADHQSATLASDTTFPAIQSGRGSSFEGDASSYMPYGDTRLPPSSRSHSQSNIGPHVHAPGPSQHWQGAGQGYGASVDLATSNFRHDQYASYAFQQTYPYEDFGLSYPRDPRYLVSGQALPQYPLYHPPYGQFQGARHVASHGQLPPLTTATPHMNNYAQARYPAQPGFYQAPPIDPARQISTLNAPRIAPFRRPHPLRSGQSFQGVESRRMSSDATPSYPRGPPRKPKQSGHAVWVGNLSPGTTIEQLKDFFSRGAAKEIESVFLISKSNCAFVNYRTATSAESAVSRFHDARLNGVRLVCRLRHGQNPAPPNALSSVVTGLQTRQVGPPRSEVSTSSPSATAVDEALASLDVTDDIRSAKDAPAVEVTREMVEPGKVRVVEKFFIVKSLTLQDLEASVRDGVWATQSHNETILNKAFGSAETVYLIFSANKSGEYFGYARMRSGIDENAIAKIPRNEPTSPMSADEPTSTLTPATDSAPPGRIVDDSARGTIFWEAESSESDSDNNTVDISEGSERIRQSRKSKPTAEEMAKQDWGKPFTIEWISTNRLPFYRTRGLRNPWNANREIKIARDGTELEPAVGRQLLQMFHTLGPDLSPLMDRQQDGFGTGPQV